ncbi:ubx domain-containing [Pyrenophora seminiperda CCB06]|uniref:Ubx domain-containing n=1 Tax=Pyrenophora seminiperda CCB06 TaxID=1302712 RepID=A0A3M7ME61_9PLEO|nr:ubx domain-containing [Pyrenophora seminiperda CCB06]
MVCPSVQVLATITYFRGRIVSYHYKHVYFPVRMDPRTRDREGTELVVVRNLGRVGNGVSLKATADGRSLVEVNSPSYNRLLTEWHYSPYRSEELSAYADAPPDDIDRRGTCAMVYIRNFTNAKKDFAYCVRGLKNVQKFWTCVHGTTQYNGPVLASPITLLGRNLHVGPGNTLPIDWRSLVKYEKTGAVNTTRWRYLYGTAIRAWNKMRLDGNALSVLMRITKDVEDLGQDDPAESLGQGAISASSANSEAKRLAIADNVRILGQKKFGSQRVVDFLMNELHGRRKWQGFETLTGYQSYIISNLMWADNCPQTWNRWIECIQKELSRPIDAPDDDSDEETESAPSISNEQTQDYTSSSYGLETAEDRLRRHETVGRARAQSGNNVQGTGQIYRMGISHAGTRLPLEAPGKVIVHMVRPIQSTNLYQRYLEMKLLLQEWYYGHEVAPFDPDPHRGVPTRERCSGQTTLVQNEGDNVDDPSDSLSQETSHQQRGLRSHNQVLDGIELTKRQIVVNTIAESPEAHSSKRFVELIVTGTPYENADYETKCQAATQIVLDDSIGANETEYTKVQRTAYIDQLMSASTQEDMSNLTHFEEDEDIFELSLPGHLEDHDDYDSDVSMADF